MMKVRYAILTFISAFGALPTLAFAQDRIVSPYFITYDHYMEETDTLEVATNQTLGRDPTINTFWSNWTEFEYGARKWWTTELYLDSQHTRHEGSVFTGFRFENRFRPFLEQHRVNPVFYVEYEHLNGADKTLKEIVGFDNVERLRVPNGVAREEKEREIETRLILSSQIGEWNLSENLIGSKGIHGGRWEFGYAVGASRPLAPITGRRCTFCKERFAAGAELYGGLGEWGDFTVRGTSQYLAPVMIWTLPSETSFRFSPGWGLTGLSVNTLIRFSVSQEIDGVGRWFGKVFRGH